MEPEPYVLQIPLHRRPRLVTGGIPTHGKTKCEYYRLPTAWCLHAYRYSANLVVDTHPICIKPGCVGVMPADVEIAMEFQSYPSTHAYLHFELDPAAATTSIAAMQPLYLRFDSFFAEMEQIIATLSINRCRAEVKLWDLLWDLADRYEQNCTADRQRHSAVANVLEAVELRLARSLRVEELAGHAGVSHNHLTRLFQKELGMTIVAYIRKRRVERAVRLLEHSTRTIKSIAAEVGVPDLQHFNKLIHQELGTSPRAVRKGNR